MSASLITINLDKPLYIVVPLLMKLL